MSGPLLRAGMTDGIADKCCSGNCLGVHPKYELCPYMKQDFSCELDAPVRTERVEVKVETLETEGQSGGPEVYISKRDALKVLDATSREYNASFFPGISISADRINKLPAADVRPVVTAEWVEAGDNQPMSADKVYCCSNCSRNRRIMQFKPFCQECGATMTNWEELNQCPKSR